MKRVDVASAIIYDRDGRILLVENKKEAKTYWSTPGGAVEPGETIKEAVIREVFEETGYHVQVGELHSVRERTFQERGQHAIIFTFFAEIIGGSLQNKDPDQDIIDIQWMDDVSASQCMSKLYKALRLDRKQEVFTPFYQLDS
ncbi:NUDIX domain-containing protein [Alkalicoccobacillus gibsonii]|uniref:NUDIX domain-containing protein n=1 Tax=Alkalicoccobacillus gibsonii TaxID=79881 RepID=UPI003F7BA169